MVHVKATMPRILVHVLESMTKIVRLASTRKTVNV